MNFKAVQHIGHMLADVRAGGVERLKLKRVWKDLVAPVHMKVIEKALGRKK